MAFQGGFAGGFGDVMVVAPRRRRGGGGRAVRWRYALEPPAPTEDVRLRAVLRVAAPVLAVRVVGVGVHVAPVVVTRSVRARLVGPAWLVAVRAAQRDAKEARELSEVALILQALGR